MSTPYELPVAPEPLGPELLGADPEAASLISRAPLRVVPDLDAVEPLDFDDFVRRQFPRLRRLVMRKLGDPNEAEEIAQETLLRAHQHLQTLRTENELVAWTTVVSQRLAIDRMRVRGRSVTVAEVPEDSRVGRDTADIVVARAEARTALESLEAIPERQAAILWAREVEGLTYDAIAARFAISEPAVRSLLHRGRRSLRQEYSARGGTLPLRGLVPLAPGLIALRGLGRLRAAAKETVRGHVGAFATLSMAGALALGIGAGFGPGGSGQRLPLKDLHSPTHVAQDSASTADEVARPAPVRTAAEPVRAEAPTAARRSPLAGVKAPCTVKEGAGRVCVTSNKSRGDVLYIGPALPDNPVTKRIGVGQNVVGVCGYVRNTPVTECRSDRSDSDRPSGHPVQSIFDTPSSFEGARP